MKQAVRKKLQRVIQDQQLSCVMNNTKWRELISEMRRLQNRGFLVQHQAKDLFGPWPSPTGWDGEWFYHLLLWNSLQWVDVRCETKASRPYKPPIALSAEERAAVWSEICACLKAKHIPFSVEDGIIRVWGYLRPGESPRWG